jgi:hypothetical protein
VLIGDVDGDVYWQHAPSLRRNGKFVRAWEILNDKVTITKNGVQQGASGKLLREYDCAEHRARTISATLFSSVGGRGQPQDLPTKEDVPWNYTQPQSVGEATERAACARNGRP